MPRRPGGKYSTGLPLMLPNGLYMWLLVPQQIEFKLAVLAFCFRYLRGSRWPTSRVSWAVRQTPILDDDFVLYRSVGAGNSINVESSSVIAFMESLQFTFGLTWSHLHTPSSCDGYSRPSSVAHSISHIRLLVFVADHIWQEGKAVCSPLLSVRLLPLLSFEPTNPWTWFLRVCVYVCVLTIVRLSLKVKVKDQCQYGRGNAVTRSVWPPLISS